jgi:hypothetical protein
MTTSRGSSSIDEPKWAAPAMSVAAAKRHVYDSRPVDEHVVVYIDRYYDDPWHAPQPWSRRCRLPGERQWSATTGGTADKNAEAEFDTVEEAIAWGRKRAEIVLVRLGSEAEACYSAGRRDATWYTDGTGWQFPRWPPSSWPEYNGYPEPGWPQFSE